MVFRARPSFSHHHPWACESTPISVSTSYWGSRLLSFSHGTQNCFIHKLFLYITCNKYISYLIQGDLHYIFVGCVCEWVVSMLAWAVWAGRKYVLCSRVITAAMVIFVLWCVIFDRLIILYFEVYESVYLPLPVRYEIKKRTISVAMPNPASGVFFPPHDTPQLKHNAEYQGTYICVIFISFVWLNHSEYNLVLSV